MSTADADGWPDASSRGDAPGFVPVESSHTLLMPERPGNNRVDSITPGRDRDEAVIVESKALTREYLHRAVDA